MLVKISEAVWIAALLHAGNEPRREDFPCMNTYVSTFDVDVPAYDDVLFERAWNRWTAKLSEVLMQGWEETGCGPPGDRKVREWERQEIQRGRLRDFYTWLSKQRGEAWAEHLECVAPGVWK